LEADSCWPQPGSSAKLARGVKSNTPEALNHQQETRPLSLSDFEQLQKRFSLDLKN
jgi:hypothetical protein